MLNIYIYWHKCSCHNCDDGRTECEDRAILKQNSQKHVFFKNKFGWTQQASVKYTFKPLLCPVSTLLTSLLKAIEDPMMRKSMKQVQNGKRHQRCIMIGVTIPKPGAGQVSRQTHWASQKGFDQNLRYIILQSPSLLSEFMLLIYTIDFYSKSFTGFFFTFLGGPSSDTLTFFPHFFDF